MEELDYKKFVKAQRKILRQIEMISLRLKKAGLSPRAYHAFMVTALVCNLLAGLSLANQWANERGWGYGWTGSPLWVAPVAVVMFAALYYFSKRPRSWEVWLDQLLCDCKPSNVRAMKELQSKVKEEGFTFRNLQEFVWAERGVHGHGRLLLERLRFPDRDLA